MNLPSVAIIAVLLAVLMLASYVDRLYSEMGKFLAREFQENIDAWEMLVEPHLGRGLGRERVALSAAVLTHLSLAALALHFGALLFDQRTPTAFGWHITRPTNSEIAQAIFGIVLVIVLFNQFLPYVFFTRTRGLWIAKFIWPLRVLFYCVLPITILLGFLLSVASLAQSAENAEAENSEAVDALIEAGEEEGILDEGDRELVRSAVEFGDKVVREVMTPRPEMFAIPEETTLEAFTEMLREHPYSRVPVFRASIDQITGIAFAHDLLQVADIEAAAHTVAEMARPAVFVPETKKVNELLREMQREKQHMRIVIDEYGGVAGLVTIEDLLEEIVGNITDEHEQPEEEEAVIREPDGSFVVPGSFELARLVELFPGFEDLPEDYEATTLAGLVTEAAGRIPYPGEVVEAEGLRLEILASTDRRVDRLKVRLVGEPSAQLSIFDAVPKAGRVEPEE